MSKRKYIDSQLSISDFFNKLNILGVKYVVLRWFQNYKLLSSQSDLDLLVADKDIKIINSLLTHEENSGNMMVDVYSVSGVSGSGYLKLPYYPKHLALKILKSRILSSDLYFVPSPDIYMLSFIFHIVFHKAESSGIPVNRNIPIGSFKINKYTEELKRFLKKTNCYFQEICLENLYDFLKQKNWLPSIEWVRKIGYNKSPWLSSLHPILREHSELTVFIIREKAKGQIIHKKLVNLFNDLGVEILFYSTFSIKQKLKAKTYIRSGKWDSGPNNKSGGLPYAAYILCDLSPEKAPIVIRKDYPYLTNYRFFKLKLKMREITNLYLGSEFDYNCIHSCDDSIEALEYINILFPEKVKNIKRKRQRICDEYSTPFKVTKQLKGNNRRAKVEIVNFKGELAVCKTYKPGKEKFYNRELLAYQTLSDRNILMPKLLYYDRNYFVTELIDYEENQQKSLLKTKLREISQIIYNLWISGVAHLDLHPGNFIVDTKGNVFVIDFEFLYQYEKPTINIFESYDIVNMPDPIAWGLRSTQPSTFINKIWKEFTGYNFKEIITNNLCINTEI